MSIANTYKEVLISDFIKKRLKQGRAVTATDIETELSSLITDRDFIRPQFLASDFYISSNSSSSAENFKTTFLAMRQDLRILYKEMIRLSMVSEGAFERWRLEARNIEKKLIDLEDRIENLLLLTQDTEGYHSILVDNFTDTNFVDLDLSTILPDLTTSTIEMGPSTSGETRIFLNNLDVASDLSFKVRTTIDFLARQDAIGTNLSNPFKQTSESWWTNIQMKNQKPVTCELTVRITSDDPIDISKIVLNLHDSSESSLMNITPLYSVDNQTYAQLPSSTFTQDVRTNAVFAFPTVKAKWIKFLLTKEGPDPSSSERFFSYQFGFQSILLFAQGFDTESTQKLITTPLSVVNENGVIDFEKLTLQVCERVEDNTKIDYFITTSNDPKVPVDTNTAWSRISPTNRVIKNFATILDVGQSLEITIGDTELDIVDTEIVKINYDGNAEKEEYVNPGRSFWLLSRDKISGDVQQDEIDNLKTGTVSRYTFTNSNDRLLNYQIQDSSLDLDSNLKINENNLVIFRNIGKQGCLDTDISTKVRGVQRGWKFSNPYYSCVIEIQNPEGLEIDVGDQAIFVDGISYSNKIDHTILTGKTNSNSGIHAIKIHKNNWVNVVPSLNSVTELRRADPLYPFNHKMLIEGYKYGESYADTDEKVYKGTDLFAETLMTSVSNFDMRHNIASDRYDVYSLDRDTPNSHMPGLDNQPSRVFVVKIDEHSADFQNERFMIRFKQINALRKYLRLRADLMTTASNVSPTLHSYKIKLA